MMFSPFLSKIVSALSAVHCYAYREKETKETIECTGALRSEVCLYEENLLGTFPGHVWVSFWPAPTVRAVSFVDMDQRAYTIHRTECLSRQNPSLIRRKNPAKF